MSQPAKRTAKVEPEPVRVLGRGLRAAKGIRLPLRTIREGSGVTQVAVEEASGIHQADISRLEGKAEFDDCQLGTLRRYLQALGGDLELVARFGDKRIIVAGIEAATKRSSPANKSPQRTGRKTARR